MKPSCLDGGGSEVEHIAEIEAVKDSFRERGGIVYHTAEQGSVRFELSAKGVVAKTFRAAP